MTRARRRDQILPPSVLLGAALLLTAVLPSSGRLPVVAAAPNAVFTECALLSPAQAAAASLRSAQASGPLVHDLLTKRGELSGRSISMATRAGRAIELALPPESFVGQQRGALLLFTTHGGAASEVRALDTDTGCETLIAATPDVARSALLSQDAESLYVHSVTRGERDDAGVTRHDLATGVISVVLEPLARDESFGPIFATEMSWAVDALTLVVQSCGFQRCLTRLVDSASGAVETYAQPSHGQLVGVTPDQIVTFAACPGRPCAVLAIDRADGSASTLATEAWSASLTSGDDGRTTVELETAAGMVEVEP